MFKTYVLERINSITDFCKIPDIKFDKMLNGLYIMSGQLESLFCRYTRERVEIKKDRYRQIGLKSMADIISSFQETFQSPYKFTPDSIIHIQDSNKKVYYRLDCTPEVCKKINQYDTIKQQSNCIHSIYKKNTTN